MLARALGQGVSAESSAPGVRNPVEHGRRSRNRLPDRLEKKLRRRPEEATLVFDGDHWIAALLPLWHVGRLLVLDVHLHPKIPYREWLQQVRRMEQLRRDLQPSYTYLAGDLNATDAPGTPLPASLSQSGPLRDYLRVLPPGTTTNHTLVKGTPRATAIDHVFIHGPVAEARHQLLSSRSSHAVIIVTVTLLTRSADAWAWRKFRWRRANPSDMDAMGAALDLVWGWLAFTPALPDDYVASHHELASQLIPRPPDTRQLMHRLAQQHFPLSPGQLDQQLADLRETAEARGFQNRLDVLRSASITSATRAALHLPIPPPGAVQRHPPPSRGRPSHERRPPRRDPPAVLGANLQPAPAAGPRVLCHPL